MTAARRPLWAPRWLLAVITLAVMPASACRPVDLGARSGFAAGGEILAADDATQNRELDAMAATGARWVRIEINWSLVQPSGPSSWSWARSVCWAIGGISSAQNSWNMPPPSWACQPCTTGTSTRDR